MNMSIDINDGSIWQRQVNNSFLFVRQADKLIMYTIKRNEHTNCMWIIECVNNTLTFVYHRVKICFNVD